eukprot:TRINITY_DN1011_c0_g1_i4.p1 TRINITY_DN1011_c0_g1~~TRINITY_DN1011_c0_g1_i4.p1  ORF type:complete len:337 (+),score=18.83 TRINITY_DN1011_c0_g1_i4:118-1128(+)
MGTRTTSSLRSRHSQICDKFDQGLTPRQVPDLIRELAETGPSVVKLGCNQLQDEGMKLLAPFIAETSTVTTLDLRGNHIGPIGCAALGKAMERNSSITKLVISGNPVEELGLEKLCRSLRNNQTITQLEWSNQNGGASDLLRKEVDGLLRENRRIHMEKQKERSKSGPRGHSSRSGSPLTVETAGLAGVRNRLNSTTLLETAWEDGEDISFEQSGGLADLSPTAKALLNHQATAPRKSRRSTGSPIGSGSLYHTGSRAEGGGAGTSGAGGAGDDVSRGNGKEGMQGRRAPPAVHTGSPSNTPPFQRGRSSLPSSPSGAMASPLQSPVPITVSSPST